MYTKEEFIRQSRRTKLFWMIFTGGEIR